VVTKLSAGAIFPAEIGFYRWLLAGLLFTPFLLPQVWRNRAAIRPHLGKVFVLGVLGMAMYQSLAYFAAGITSATNMGIILSLMPLMSLALSIAWLGQRLSYGALLGALVSFFGVLEVVSPASRQLLHQGLNSGDLMMLVATLAYALYSFLLKKWQLRLPPMQLLYLQVLVAIVVLLPLFLLSDKTGLNSHNIGLVLYACVLASMIAPRVWMQACTAWGRAGPRCSSTCCRGTAVIAVVLDEQLASYHLVAGC
jgi:drug/metabolite transporter (DMT)-like permease